MQPLTTPAPAPYAQTPVMGPAMQDILNRLPQVTNILVTVKANPSVDELAAALGLTIALNNVGKHATAVFSGQIPDAMSFLKPDKTFESDVHSLRDFIISLNKEKADKLRFAQEGEIVKIFITPKSNISSQDLSYNAGDFNVEMVLAIGIASQNELDSVIAAHGKILHEATVATLTAGPTPSAIGSINWFEPALTSASAMVLQLLQAINPPVAISPDIATALLTGLVADTNMFSNQNTSPKTMELAAMLMSAGANHQLVTSSIGIHPQTIPTPTPTEVATPTPTADQPETAPILESTNSTNVAPNTIPMVQDNPVEEPAVAPTIEPVPIAEEITPLPVALSTEALAKAEEPTPVAAISPALSDALPKPVDITAPVVPADLMPPAQPILDAPAAVAPIAQPTPTPLATPLGDQPVAPINEPIAATLAPVAPAADHPDQIRSEIDQIYGAAPYDTVGQAEQPLATAPNLDPDLADTALPSSLLTNSPVSSNQTLDTSVQLDQANASTTSSAREEVSQALNTPKAPTPDLGLGLGSVPATRTEDVSSNDLLGIDSLPKLEIPTQLPPPPPPPPAGTAPAFQPTIDFSQINQS